MGAKPQDKHVLVDPALHRAAKAQAAVLGRSLREVVADLLTRWLRQQKRAR